jgi:hypothetical protein
MEVRMDWANSHCIETMVRLHLCNNTRKLELLCEPELLDMRLHLLPGVNIDLWRFMRKLIHPALVVELFVEISA